MKYRDIFEEDTRYKKYCTQDNDAPVPFKVGTLGPTQFSQILPTTPLYLHESYGCSEISSLSKVILIWGKARSHRTPNLGCRGAESAGRFDVLPKNSGDMMHEQACYRDEAANHQLPIAAAF